MSRRDFKDSRRLRLDDALTPVEPMRPVYRLGYPRATLPVPRVRRSRPSLFLRLWRAFLRSL